MKMTKLRSGFFFLVLLLLQTLLAAQDNNGLREGTFSDNIRSVLITREGWKLSYPVIELNEKVRLVLTFDDISDRVKNYNYRIIHCDFNWEPSRISESDYIEGFRQNQLNNYAFSFNTYTKYVHYTLMMPNPDVNFLVSGNYIIEVFEDYNEDQPVFRKRFVVAESIAKVTPSIQRPVLTVFRDNSQEINFTVEHRSFNIDNPYSDVKVSIIQNGRWDNPVNNLKPLFDRGGILEYNDQKENIFPGGNEYRWFDIKSLRYQSPYIKEIVFRDGYFHVTLFPDESKKGKPYFYNQDLNGRFYVEIQEEKNSELDADYVYVHFTLLYDDPVAGGDFYVMGYLTGNEYSGNNRMKYNNSSKAYEATLLLKQGFYNYRYEFLPKGAVKGDPSLTEGNHYETENDYIIFVYYSGIRSRYDRVTGYQIANSLNRK